MRQAQNYAHNIIRYIMVDTIMVKIYIVMFSILVCYRVAVVLSLSLIIIYTLCGVQEGVPAGGYHQENIRIGKRLLPH